MKILTVLGTRPEIIRLSRVIEKLDGLCELTLVHTGQSILPGRTHIFGCPLCTGASTNLGVVGSSPQARLLPA